MSARRILTQCLSALARPVYGGIGSIVCLHRVLENRSILSENRALEITPQMLREVLLWVHKKGLEPLRMEEVSTRLQQRLSRKFIVFTFDDGYVDNFREALPIFREFAIPFTVYLASDFLDRRSAPWWLALETVLRSEREWVWSWQGRQERLRLEQEVDQERAFLRFADFIRSAGKNEREARIEAVFAQHETALRRASETILTWEQARDFAKDPLVSIGSHTAGHHTLARLTEAEVRAEFQSASERIQHQLGSTPDHLAYPFGSPSAVGTREFSLAREAGFVTATTTRMGNLFSSHRHSLHSLPRLSLTGGYADSAARLALLESGLVPAKLHAGRRVITA